MPVPVVPEPAGGHSRHPQQPCCQRSGDLIGTTPAFGQFHAPSRQHDRAQQQRLSCGERRSHRRLPMMAFRSRSSRRWVLAPANRHGKRLRKRCGRNRSHLFTFLDHPDKPPDNNGSERELRPTATYRKVTGGFRSNWGADLFAAVRSVVGTAARHGTDAYQAIHAILGGASSRVVEQLQRLMRRGCFL
jgi:hypothetical protein